ncbi:MAG TPA: hypothetical protein VF039_11565 [Longimicrobiales bacterium]
MRSVPVSSVPAVVGVLAALLAPPAPCSAQQEEETYSQVDLRDGGSVFGNVVRAGDRVLVIRGADTLSLPGSQVERIRDVRGRMIDGQFMRQDPNETRLFFGPTGRTLPRGESYLGVFELYLPFLAYGVTDRVTVAGGIPLFFGDDLPMILYVAPKVQLIRTDALSGSVGTLSFFTSEGNAGLVYGAATVETRDGRASLTGGGGGAYAEGEMADGAVLMLGGDVRVSRSLKLLTENYLIDDDYDSVALLSFGIRFIGERLSADVGLAIPSEASIALPLVNFVYSF